MVYLASGKSARGRTLYAKGRTLAALPLKEDIWLRNKLVILFYSITVDIKSFKKHKKTCEGSCYPHKNYPHKKVHVIRIIIRIRSRIFVTLHSSII